MPHQCTDCDRRFDDGSKAMLSGCPDCAGNTFQFIPANGEADEQPPQPEEPPEPAVDSTVARTVGNAATAVRDLVSSTDQPPRTEPPSEQTAPETPAGGSVAGSQGTSSPATSAEDTAQATARSEIVDPGDLPRSSTSLTERGPIGSPCDDAPDPSDGRQTEASPTAEQTVRNPSPGDKPGLDDLREELNQQFESIRVLEPGQYELNLMELYDREEYIIALQEDGKYTIQVPERWERD